MLNEHDSRNPFVDGHSAAILNGMDNWEGVDLKSYKYVRVQSWPAVSFDVSGFRRLFPRNQKEVAADILNTMNAVYDNSDTRGTVLFSKRCINPNLILLSDTSLSVNQHFHTVKHTCRWTPRLVDDPEQRPSAYPRRILYLISMELYRYRLVEEKCKGCGDQHWFWFDASDPIALTALRRWRKWIELEPFDSEGVLKEVWRRKVDRQRRYLSTLDADFSLAQWIDDFVNLGEKLD